MCDHYNCDLKKSFGLSAKQNAFTADYVCKLFGPQMPLLSPDEFGAEDLVDTTSEPPFKASSGLVFLFHAKYDATCAVRSF